MAIRLKIILFFLLLAGAAIIGRLFWLQVVKHDLYSALAQGQQKFFSEVNGERGEIYFKGGETLATRQTYTAVYLSPKEMDESDSSQITGREKIKKILSQVLGLKEDLIGKKLRNDGYSLLKNKISAEEEDNLKRLSLAGVDLVPETFPSFPQKNMASQTVGFVDSDGQGQYGLEAYYQAILEGKNISLEGERGARGFITSLSENPTAPKGSDLVLTLDYQVQFMTERLLQAAQKELLFESGTIIVVRPENGEIVALANFPNFDPNSYELENDLDVFQNPATQKIFEPGSVFKPLTMAAGIEEKKITPQTTYTDEGVVKIGRIPIKNYDNRKYGVRTMTEVLERSINTGAVFAEQQLGSDLFLKYLEKFGFFEKTGVDLQGEVFSQNQEFKKGYEINFATASFGQGIEITPLQLVRAFCAIANGGQLVNPHLVEKIIDPAGRAKEVFQPEGKRVISSQTSSQVVTMMTSVVEKGYSQKAKIPGYFIAGKTGTAQVSWGAMDVNKPGYSDETIQSFIGFAPAFNPRFLILVKLDNPGAKTAEYSAMPIFHDLAKYIIDLWQIPPDYQP